MILTRFLPHNENKKIFEKKRNPVKINKLATVLGSLVFTVSLTLGYAMNAQAADSASLDSVKSSIVLTAISTADQVSIDAVTAAQATYLAALQTYQSAPANGKASKQAYKRALQAWQKLNNSQKKAKQQIGKTFKATVASAKAKFKAAMAASNAGSSKAEAKAARDAAIAGASVARNDALACISFSTKKPEKPTKY